MVRRQRLDQMLIQRGLVLSRSQGENLIRLGKVRVGRQVQTKPGYFVGVADDIRVEAGETYVSRAGLKLASVAAALQLDFKGKTVLDVGSSTGGFTDYALKHGAEKVIAVDVGTDQLHPSLRSDARIELHEKTDIRQVFAAGPAGKSAPENFSTLSKTFSGAAPLAVTREPVLISDRPDIIVVDVSFISLREVLPHIAHNLCSASTQIAAMVKPQFEAGRGSTNGGIIKNDAVRRKVLQDFETWAKQYYVLSLKRDSDIPGAKGNRERFYLLRLPGHKV